jgi:hypothetical protein
MITLSHTVMCILNQNISGGLDEHNVCTIAGPMTSFMLLEY